MRLTADSNMRLHPQGVRACMWLRRSARDMCRIGFISACME